MPIDPSKLQKDNGRPASWQDSKPTFYASIVCVIIVVALVLFRLFKKKKDAPTSLSAREYRKFKLVAKNDINHNTISFRFALPSAEHRLGLPVGKHVVVRKPAESKDADPISRSYTPVTSDEQLGWFELVIKIYDQGKMSQYLKHLPLNTDVEMRGPQGSLSYLGHGKFEILRRDTATNTTVTKPYAIKNVGLIAGGTGLTPMLQIVREVVKRVHDTTRLSFIFANVTEADIILRKELDGLAERHPNFRVYYTLDKPADDWKMGKGFVNQQMISEQMPKPAADTLILVCGPPPMCKAQEGNLKALGYTDDQIFIY